MNIWDWLHKKLITSFKFQNKYQIRYSKNCRVQVFSSKNGMWLLSSLASLQKLSQHHLWSTLPFSLTIIPFLHMNPSSFWWVPRVQRHDNMLCISKATCMHTVRSWFRLFRYPPAVGHPKSQFHYQTHAIRMCGHMRCEMSANVTKATTKVTIFVHLSCLFSACSNVCFRKLANWRPATHFRRYFGKCILTIRIIPQVKSSLTLFFLYWI